jgi:hypothetical protein
MGFNSYASFRSVVGSWADTDVTVTSLDQAIKMGENYVNRRLRIELMEADLAVTINSAGVATLPTDYLEAQFLYLNRSPTRLLTKKPVEWIFRNYPTRTTTGIPCFVAETNSTFIFGPPPSSQDTVNGTYYAKPNSLPGTGTINSVFSEVPEVYLWAALANAELFLGRDQRTAWQQKCDEGIERANKEDKRKKMSGGPISMSPG